MPARPLALGLRGPNRVAMGRVRRMVAALRRIGGSLWMVDNAFSGAFVDNVGTTPVTAYAYLLGLTTDRLGVLGLDVVGLASSWQSLGAGFALGGGVMTLTSAATSTYAFKGVGLTASKTYRFDVVVGSLSGGVIQIQTNGNAFTISAAGTYTFIQKPGAIDGPYVAVTSGTVSAQITRLDWRELTGNHATQSAVASKPSVQRVPKRTRGATNLWTYSHDLSNAIWMKAAATVVGTKIVASAANTYHHAARSLTVAAGTTQTLAFEVSAAEYELMRFADGSNGRVFASVNATTGAVSLTGGADFLSATTVVMPSGRVLFAVAINGSNTALAMCFVGYPNATTPTNWGATYLGDGTSGINVHAQALFTGTVTAQQILDNGGIPLTTTTALPNVLEWATVISFDGSNDFLQTGITTGNEGWWCAGVNATSYPATKTLFWTGANAPAEVGATLRVLSGGGVQMVTGDGVAQAAVGAGVAATAGVPQVIDGGWTSTALLVAIDGTEATGTNTRGGASTQTLKIGNSASGQSFLGNLYAGVYAPVLPDTADRATIRNGIAALQGRTL